MRAALLAPVDRNEHFLGLPGLVAHAGQRGPARPRAVAPTRVTPLAGRDGGQPRRPGHPGRRFAAPASFGGLFLQSGSFFHAQPAADFATSATTSPRFRRIAASSTTWPSAAAPPAGPGRPDLRHGRGERQQPGRPRRPGRGWQVSWPSIATPTTGWPGAIPLIPGWPGCCRSCGVDGMRRDYVGLWSPAIGAEGGLLAGHHGRPLLAFQSEQGRCSGYEDRGMIDAVAEPDRGRPGQGLLGRQLRRGQLVRPQPPLEARAAQHGKFELGPQPGGPLHPRRLRWPARHHGHPGPASAPSTRPTSPSARPTCFPWPSTRAASTPARWAGERGDAVYFNNPMDYVANLGATTSTGCGAGCRCC